MSFLVNSLSTFGLSVPAAAVYTLFEVAAPTGLNLKKLVTVYGFSSLVAV